MKSTLLKSIFVLALLGLFTSASQAQKPTDPPKSPADSTTGKVGNANIKIKYSSPSVRERKIWGELVPYNQVWRAGANEATVFSTDKDITIEGKPLAAGKYAFFTIPTEKEWTIIFNKEPKQWGAFDYKENKDALRVKVTPRKSSAFQESMKYVINKEGVVLRWENLEVPVSIQ